MSGKSLLFNALFFGSSSSLLHDVFSSSTTVLDVGEVEPWGDEISSFSSLCKLGSRSLFLPTFLVLVSFEAADCRKLLCSDVALIHKAKQNNFYL